MVCFLKKVLKDGGFFVSKGYQHLHLLSSPCFFYMDFAVRFLSIVFLLRGVGFHWGKGSQMSCRNLGDAFEKSIYLFIFWGKKKKKPHHGIPAGLRLLLAASFLTYENPGTSSKATFLCMVKARVSVGGRQRAGSRALIVQPSQVTLRGCGHIHGILHPSA